MAIAAAIVAVVGAGVAVGGTIAENNALEDAANAQKRAAEQAREESNSLLKNIDDFNQATVDEEERIRNNTDRKAALARKRGTAAQTGRRRSILGGADNAKARNQNAVQGES